MFNETLDSLVGSIANKPAIVCFLSDPIHVKKVVVKRSDSLWATALPAEGTLTFLECDLPEGTRWCFDYLVSRLRKIGWDVGVTKKCDRKDGEKCQWDDACGLAGSLA